MHDLRRPIVVNSLDRSKPLIDLLVSMAYVIKQRMPCECIQFGSIGQRADGTTYSTSGVVSKCIRCTTLEKYEALVKQEECDAKATKHREPPMNNLETASNENISAEKQRQHELEEAGVVQWKDWVDEGKKAYLKQESAPGHLPTPQEELNFSIAYAIRKLLSNNLEANTKLIDAMCDAEATVLAFLGDVAFNSSVCGTKQTAVVDMFARLHALRQACFGGTIPQTPTSTKQMQDQLDESYRSLAAKGRLLLTVELNTPEQAGELMRWMYATHKPMRSNLLEIAWDKVAVPATHAAALKTLIDTVRES